MEIEILKLIGGLILLVLGGDWLLKSAIGISLKLNIPKMIIGMTIVSLATSMPELIVSINAALSGHADLSLGNVVGSNIANIGLVLGVVGLLTTLKIDKSFLGLDWPVLMGSSLLFLGLLYDGTISQIDGIILLVLLAAFLFYLIKYQAKKINSEEEEDDEIVPLSNPKIIFFLIIGGLGLWGGSELLVNSAVSIANTLGIDEKVIAVTMVAVGTSIPELAASILAIIRKEKAISLGNLIGSNIFNIHAVLGTTAVITPIHLTNKSLLSFDMIWVLAFVLVLIPLLFLPKKKELGKWKGALLLGAYISYIFLVI